MEVGTYIARNALKAADDDEQSESYRVRWGKIEVVTCVTMFTEATSTSPSSNVAMTRPAFASWCGCEKTI
jgi:hypothetical protein